MGFYRIVENCCTHVTGMTIKTIKKNIRKGGNPLKELMSRQ